MRSGKLSIFIALLLTALISGCSSNEPAAVQIRKLAKSDVDLVTDLYRQQLRQLTHQLTIKLYKRNPRELKKNPQATVESRLAQLYPPVHLNADKLPLPRVHYAELYQKDSISAVELAFAPDFKGDRVFALMIGITGMINASYEHRHEFFMVDRLNQQKLYNSARNLEVIAWQLRNRKDLSGQPLILSTGVDKTGVVNLSYERMFGKMIAHQDMLAQIIADGTSRTLNRVIQGAASMTLLPI
ncbi:MAG: hypothetical protein OIF57_07985 [Marinobacterium sp.]|nr:hypothetical protein [Marinobacterium sp.]